jgi:hypothetical protein
LAGQVSFPLSFASPALSTFIIDELVALLRNSGTWKVPFTVRTDPLVATEDTVKFGAAFPLRVLYAWARMVSAGPAMDISLATVKSHAMYGVVLPSRPCSCTLIRFLMYADRNAGLRVPWSAASVEAAGGIASSLVFLRFRSTTAYRYPSVSA